MNFPKELHAPDNDLGLDDAVADCLSEVADAEDRPKHRQAQQHAGNETRDQELPDVEMRDGHPRPPGDVQYRFLVFVAAAAVD